MTFREILLRRGIPWHSAPNNHLSICCPSCPQNGESPDTRFRLSINLENGACLCFNCGFKRKSNSFTVILKELNLNVDRVDTDPETEKETEAPQLPQDFQLLDRAESDLDKIAIRYLRSRGITPEQVLHHRIGVSLTGRYAYRIVFPVRDDKKLMGIVARDFTDRQEPRYLNSTGDKGLYNCNGQDCKTVVLSEGIFKSLRIERLNTGFPSMALLGKFVSEVQLEQLKRRGCKEVILWADPDKPGRMGATTVCDRLAELGYLVGVVWPIWQPADEEPLEAMQTAWNTRVQGWSWRLRQRILLGA